MVEPNTLKSFPRGSSGGISAPGSRSTGRAGSPGTGRVQAAATGNVTGGLPGALRTGLALVMTVVVVLGLIWFFLGRI
ncbi:MAG: hypothetical protein ACXWOW_05380 [Candidatus Limnocylindrales bacterium]